MSFGMFPKPFRYHFMLKMSGTLMNCHLSLHRPLFAHQYPYLTYPLPENSFSFTQQAPWYLQFTYPLSLTSFQLWSGHYVGWPRPCVGYFCSLFLPNSSYCHISPFFPLPHHPPFITSPFDFLTQFLSYLFFLIPKASGTMVSWFSMSPYPRFPWLTDDAPNTYLISWANPSFPVR